MRSHLLLLGIASLALSACGKDGNPNARMEGHLGHGFQAMNGVCTDPLQQLPYQPIDRVEDIGPGAYTIIGFKAVGIAMDASSGAGGISVVEGVPGAERIDYGRICSDFSSLSNSEFAWGVSAPYSLTTANPSIHEEISFKQEVISGAIARDGAQVAPSMECKSVASLFPSSLAGNAYGAAAGSCVEARLYRLDPSTIGVLRVVDSQDARGMMIRSKIFVEYSSTPGTQSKIIHSKTPPVSYHEENGGAINQEPSKKPARRVVKASDAKRKLGYTPKKVSTPESEKIGDIEIQVSSPTQPKQNCSSSVKTCGEKKKQTVVVVPQKVTVVVPAAPAATRVTHAGKTVIVPQAKQTKIVSKDKSTEETVNVSGSTVIESKKKEKSKLKVKVKN